MAERVFLSYSRADSDAVDRLASGLRTAGVGVWLDHSGIEAGTRWPEEIAKALTAAEVVLLALSPSALASEYVLSEITLAYEHRKPMLVLELEPAQIPPAFRLQLAGKQRLSLAGRGGDEMTADLLGALSSMGQPTRDGGCGPLGDERTPAGVAPPGRQQGNLSASLSSFVGRENEIDGLEVAWSDSMTRLLVLTGPGGVGKTRLALHFARQHGERFADGAWFSDLAAATEPDELAIEIAQTLGVRTEPGAPPLQSLSGHLRSRAALLVMDNCEQAIVPCAKLLSVLLAQCPLLRVIATSREPLGVDGEVDVPIAPLAVPGPLGSRDSEALAEVSSVRLFVDRARAANPAFALTPGNAPAVSEICRRLDGLPLALELAAARVRAMPVEQIAARLDQKLSLLSGGGRAAHARQQSLRALMDWSWELLTADERQLFARTGVFEGGFSLEAARCVCFEPQAEDWAALDLLLPLVAKSLLALRDRADGTLRYGMLETVRDYAAARLAEDADRDGVARRHCAYYRDLVARDGSPGHVALGHDTANIRAALAWAQLGDPVVGLAFACELRDFWIEQSAWRDGCRTVESMLARATHADVGLRARAYAVTGALAVVGGRLAQADRELSLAESLARDGDHRSCLADALYWQAVVARERGALVDAESLLEGASAAGGATAVIAKEQASVAFYRGDLAVARSRCEEALSLVRDPRTEDVHLTSCAMLALLDHMDGRLDQAEAGYHRVLQVAEERGNRRIAAETHSRLGELLAARQRYGEALTTFHQSIRLQRDLSALTDLAGSLHGLGEVYRALAQNDLAAAAFAECLEINLEQSNSRGTRYALLGLAQVLCDTGSPEDAARLVGVIDGPMAGREGGGGPLPKDTDTVAEQVLRALGEAAYDRGMTIGRSMTRTELLAFLDDRRWRQPAAACVPPPANGHAPPH